MKLQKEIQEQKSKKERALRELKTSKLAAKHKLDNLEYFKGFEVNLISCGDVLFQNQRIALCMLNLPFCYRMI